MIFQGSKNHLYDVSLINYNRRFVVRVSSEFTNANMKIFDMMVYRYDIQRQISQ